MRSLLGGTIGMGPKPPPPQPARKAKAPKREIEKYQELSKEQKAAAARMLGISAPDGSDKVKPGGGPGGGCCGGGGGSPGPPKPGGKGGCPFGGGKGTQGSILGPSAELEQGGQSAGKGGGPFAGGGPGKGEEGRMDFLIEVLKKAKEDQNRREAERDAQMNGASPGNSEAQENVAPEAKPQMPGFGLQPNGVGMPLGMPPGAAQQGRAEMEKALVTAMSQMFQAGKQSNSAEAIAAQFPSRKEPFKYVGSQKELASIRKRCEKEPFVDKDFPPAFNQYVKQWCRPSEIQACDFKPVDPGSHWHLFAKNVGAADVAQGIIGDCWLMSSISALAEFRKGRYIRALLPKQSEICAQGVYLVRLFLAGAWREILLDDRFPCAGGENDYATHAAYAQLRRRQLWAGLIEKAYAKACGSYEALSGGREEEALTALTGYPCWEFTMAPGDFDSEALWTELKVAKKAGFLLTCTSRADSQAMQLVGLVDQHAYAIVDILQLKNKVRLVKLRNPQGDAPERTWMGNWSHKSDKWTPKLRETLGYDQKSEQLGIIFMSFQDFQHYFQRCTICKIAGQTWSEVRAEFVVPRNLPPTTGVVIEVPESEGKVDCHIVLHQAEKRLRYGPLFKGAFEPLADIGIVVLPLGGEQESRPAAAKCLWGALSPSACSRAKWLPSAVAVGRIRHRPTVPVECCLQPGKYIVVPLSIHTGTNRKLQIVCNSSSPVSMEVQALEPEQMRSAWAAYALHRTAGEGEKFQSRRLDCGAELLLTQGSGSAVVALALNASAKPLNVEMRLVSEGLRYSRKQNKSADYLMPGQAQVVQVAFPDPLGKMPLWLHDIRLEVCDVPPAKLRHTPELSKGKVMGTLHTPFRACVVEAPPLPDEPGPGSAEVLELPTAPSSQGVCPGAAFFKRPSVDEQVAESSCESL